LKKKLLLFIAIFMTTILFANNIRVTNANLTGLNPIDNFALVQFNIEWENSWRTSTAPYNWDAAWVFVKYRVAEKNGGDGLWHHATLNLTGNSAPVSGTIAPASDGTGAIIYRTFDGNGHFSLSDVQLRWNYGLNYKTGTTPIDDNDFIDIKVYAIEMVLVTQGAFTVGSSGMESGSFTNGSWTSGATIALSIVSESLLTIGQTAGNLWGTSSAGNNTIGSPGALAASFPKGFKAFYCMKYEISQQGYVDFLNSLTQTQATTRKYNKSSPNYRYEISGSSVGYYSTTNPFVACNFLSWADVAAYLDWSGLRPMTELEFEKACRGTLPPVAWEYAWGANGCASSAYTLSNMGDNNEKIVNNYGEIVGNATYLTTDGSIDGPLRVGIFADNLKNTGRVTAGATYYGIMEMSGNLWERTITLGNITGRTFTGAHGDGVLDNSGNANASNWPGINASGAGMRGGPWSNGPAYMMVSGRYFAAYTYADRNFHVGGRGVRSFLFPCGSSLTIDHTEGEVAPVTKTVTYGTVTNIPGEPLKCWITSNLGADHQASDVNDATEASAGWYWQFNSKRGFKHDGTTMTPNITWNSNISESSDWIAGNDPCALELGDGWRIPTSTEWTNVDAIGGWTTGNGAWTSDLKLHFAGQLYSHNGSMDFRGSYGYFWSCNEETDDTGFDLFIGNGNSNMENDYKANGLSLRCVRDL
jgi:formylglycine-generating enzyme required for sulfatase activity